MKKLLLLPLLSGLLVFSLPISNVMADGGTSKDEVKQIKKSYKKLQRKRAYKYKRMGRKRGSLGELSERNKQMQRDRRKEEIAKEKDGGNVKSTSRERKERRKNRIKDEKNKKSERRNSRNGYGEFDENF